MKTAYSPAAASTLSTLDPFLRLRAEFILDDLDKTLADSRFYHWLQVAEKQLVVIRFTPEWVALGELHGDTVTILEIAPRDRFVHLGQR